MTVSVLYLHGFASSPGSKKAAFFRPHIEGTGAHYAVPDLNAPDFQHLTLTAMLERVAEAVRACPPGPVYLIGSSMGGLTATHFIDRYQQAEAARVEKMILLAPAFDFIANREAALGPGWQERWRDEGHLMVYNFASDAQVPVHYGLLEDLLQYDSFSVTIPIPVMIYHGKGDESVDYHQSVRFAEPRETVTLHLLESDHQLLDQTDLILDGILRFFGLSSVT